MPTPQIVLLLLFTFPSIARAETKVFYFGGHAAGPSQISKWESCSRQNAPPGYDFQGFPFQGTAAGKKKAWSAERAVAGGQEYISQVVQEINQNPEKSYIVVGHSSGSAISNKVIEKVKDIRNVRLVALDGFYPVGVQNRPGLNFTCWYGESLTKKNKKGTPLRSNNYESMVNNCLKGHARRYADSRCETAWCLHFALAMKSTKSNLSNKTYGSNGYDGCDANLDWLSEK